MATRSHMKATARELQDRCSPQDLGHDGAGRWCPAPPHHRARANQAAGLHRHRARTRQEPGRRPGHRGAPVCPAGRPVTWRGGETGWPTGPGRAGGSAHQASSEFQPGRGRGAGRLAGARSRPARAGDPARLGPGARPLPPGRPPVAPSHPDRRRAVPSSRSPRLAAVPDSPPGGLEP